MAFIGTRILIHRGIARLKGLVPQDIPYEERLPSGDWSAFFGNYVGQRYGPYDTNTCWDYGLVDCVEDQMKYLLANDLISSEDAQWLKDTGFIDQDGDPYLSRRWIAILSGAKNSGNDEAIGWKLAEQFGMVPFSMLPYSTDRAYRFATYDDFIADYFDPGAITPEMEAVGKRFLEIFDIRSEELGARWTDRSPDDLARALRQAPLQIGVPIPAAASNWNQPSLKWDGSSRMPRHSVELSSYVPGDPFPIRIYDSYEPHVKALSADYPMPIVTRGVVTARDPMLGPRLRTGAWVALIAILRRLGILR